MKYHAACTLFSLDPEIDHDEKVITQAYRKGMLIYHPDKRKDTNKELVDKEYHEFVKAYEIIKQGKPSEEDLIPRETAINATTSIYEMASVIIVYYANRKTTVSQHIGFVYTAYELFTNCKKECTIDIAYEGTMRKVVVDYIATPECMTDTLYGMGHKNFDEYRGNIIIVCKVENDPNEAFEYEETSKVLTIRKKYKSRYGIGKHTIPLYIGDYHDNFVIENANPGQVYDVGFHNIYKTVRIKLQLID
jgi:hypothetical protein